MQVIVKAFPNNAQSAGRRRSPYISFTLGKALVFDEMLDFENESGFVLAEITAELGDDTRGVFKAKALEVLNGSTSRPIHLPATMYSKTNYNGIVVIEPAVASPTGYVLSAGVRDVILKTPGVYAVLVKHADGSWHP